MTLRAGKLPPDLLRELLARVPHRDPRVAIGPALGRDGAVLALGDRMLVATSDPVTFATDALGWYAVQVNANDIACMGARPAWMLATALLPPGTPDELPGRIFDDLVAACDALSIELIGGHIEVTPGIDRAIISATMIGEAAPDEIVTGEGIEDGDVVVLTKWAAIEGTALLAREAPDTLLAQGVPQAIIDRAAALLFEPGISIVAEARAVASATHPRLMHDPTEGGIATALHEMAQAAGATLVIDPAAVAVGAETRAVCDALALDPLGLLASGALLAIVHADAYGAVAKALASAKIECHAIGRVAAGRARAIMDVAGAEQPLVSFPRDELARFFEAQALRGRGGADTTPEGRSA